jgi:uncharacterized membrane protein
MSERLSYGAAHDRTLPAIVYALYLIGIVSGFTVLIGLLLAYLNRDQATPETRTHYTFLIRTFWLWIVWMLIGGALLIWGGIFSLILVGLPFLALGWIILGLVHAWFALRAIVGVIYLARGEAYPRPYSWLL